MTTGVSTSNHHTISREQASRIVDLAISALKNPENEKSLRTILDECASIADPMIQFQLKFTKLVPKVLEILGSQIEEVLGHSVQQPQVMGYIGQVQLMAQNDVKLSVQIGKVLKTLSGDFSGLYEEDEVLSGCQEPEEID
jgi:hypothetical protein